MKLCSLKVFICFKDEHIKLEKAAGKIYQQLNKINKLLVEDMLAKLNNLHNCPLNILRSIEAKEDECKYKMEVGDKYGGVVLHQIASVFPKRSTFFYFEAFGGKIKTSAMDPMSVWSSLKEVFKGEGLKSFRIDLALSYLDKE